MADISKITLPNGSTYNLKDDYINPYIEHTEDTQQSLTTYRTKIKSNVVDSNDVIQHYSSIMIENNSDHTGEIYLSVDGASGNQTILSMSCDGTTDDAYLYLVGDTTIYDDLTVYKDSYFSDHLYLSDRTGTSSHNDYNFIAGSYYDGKINNYYAAEGYHAFYTNSTGEGTGTGRFYIYDDHIYSNVPLQIPASSLYNTTGTATFYITSYTTPNITLNAHATTYNTITVSSQTTDATYNYYPLCIAGWTNSENHVAVTRAYLNNRSTGGCTINYSVVNASTSTQSNKTVSFYILWFRARGF